MRLTLIFAICNLGLALAVFALPLPESARAWTLVIQLGIQIGVLARVALRQKLGGPFSPLTAFLFIYAGLPMSGVYLLTGHRAITFDFALSAPDLPAFSLAALLGLLGVSCFVCGYFSIWRMPADLEPVSPPPRPPMLMTAVVCVSAIGAFGWWMFVSSSGGVSNLVNNIHLRTQLRSSDYFRALSQLLQIATWAWLMFDPRATKRPLFWAHALAIFLMLFVMGQRTTILLHLLCFEVLRFLRSAPRQGSGFSNTLRLGAFAGAMVVMLIGVLWWRGAATDVAGSGLTSSAILEQADAGMDPSRLASNLFGQSNLPSMEILTMLVKTFPQEVPYLEGESYLWLAASPVPRSMWPDKPYNLGLFFNQAVEGPLTRTGRPPGLIGEFYLNFAVPGVLLGCLFAGAFCSFVARIYWSSKRGPAASLAFALFILYFIALWTKVELKQGIIRFAFYAAGLLLFYFLTYGRLPLRRLSLLFHSRSS